MLFDLVYSLLEIWVFICTPIIACVSVHNIVGRYIGQLIYTNLLSRLSYITFGFVFVPIHELSHALIAVLFGHRIKKIQFIGFDNGGLSGFVSHSWNSNNLYQQIGLFFIGIAPIFAPITFAAYLVTKYNLGVDMTEKSVHGLLAIDWYELIAFSLLSFYCIPSFTDLKNTMRGGVTVSIACTAITVILAHILNLNITGNINFDISLKAALLFSTISLLGWLFFFLIALVNMSIKKICL